MEKLILNKKVDPQYYNKQKADILGYFVYDLIPDGIFEEFVKRWSKVDKMSEHDFIELCEQINYNNYYHGLKDMKDHYKFYLKGCISARYPTLSIHPVDIFKDLINDVWNSFDIHHNYPAGAPSAHDLLNHKLEE